MKIGQLTFFRANNYGAVLQAYALQKKIEAMYGHCECIDYRCDAIERMHSGRPVRRGLGLKTNLINMMKNLYYAPRQRIFSSFREQIKHSKPYFPDTISETNAEYDLFITGSDQVFNLNLTDGDETYFLDFVNGSRRKVAYAASMGPFLEEKTETYRKLLSRFDLLSIRESSTAAELRDRLGIECAVVPDPVFLLDAEEWKRMFNLKTDDTGKKYVLIYALFNSPELYRLAHEYAQKNGCKVYVITKSTHPSGKADRYIRNTDPGEFVRLIMNAEYVVTDSFHGTAFSLIFHKQFKTVMPPNAQNRILDLFEELGIAEGQAVSDYDQIDPKLAAYGKKGEAFLGRIRALR